MPSSVEIAQGSGRELWRPSELSLCLLLQKILMILSVLCTTLTLIHAVCFIIKNELEIITGKAVGICSGKQSLDS